MMLVSACAQNTGRGIVDSNAPLRVKAEDERLAKERLASDDAKQRRTTSSLGLARLMAAQGQLEIAASYLDEAKGQEPKNPEVYALEGAVLRKQGKLKGAQEAYRKALSLAPELAEAHDGLGVIANLQGRRQDALEHHKMAVGSAPQESRFQNNLGFTYYLLNETEQAIDAFRLAVAGDPASSQYHNNLAFAYGRSGRYAEAFFEFQQAGILVEAYNNLGFVYQSQGRFAEAAELYSKALDLDPGMNQARENLRTICDRISNVEKLCLVQESRLEGAR